jgi:phage tail-like protein
VSGPTDIGWVIPGGTALVPRGGARRSGDTGDYRYLEDVVRIRYPVRDAKAYLNRHLGNRVRYELVEARRGEEVGEIREVRVEPQGGDAIVRVRSERRLPDGSVASFHAPDGMVETVTLVEVEGNRPLRPLQPRDQVFLVVPVRSYLRFLPGIYRGAMPTRSAEVQPVSERSARQWGARAASRNTSVDANSSDQFRRFLFIFQHLMTTVTDQIDDLPYLTDPLAADPDFLPWIASWVAFPLDEDLPLHRQRELVRRSISLYRSRGTVMGITEMIRVLTGADVRIVERRRPRSATMGTGTTLGSMRLAGGRTIAERYRLGEPAATYIVEPDRSDTTFFVVTLEDQASFKERFGERAETEIRRIVQIVSNERPAHVTFTIEFEGATS